MATKLATILADFQTTLSTEIAIGGTTATLSSATDDDSVALPSGRYFFTLDNSTSSKEHISCDLVGTALTNIKSLSRQGVETTGTVRKHRIGASVTLTDFGHIKFINDLVSGATTLNSTAPLGYDGAPSSLAGNQLATVTYVLGVVNGGAVTFDQQIISNQTSGEALAINDLVYFKEADARWYKVDADLTATFDQLQTGINKTTAGASGVTIQVAISGPVSGFTGLTAGSKYYASNTAGSITTTAGTYSVFVGWALTTTTLLFNAEGKTLPTQKEKDALVGSQGIPDTNNKYVTQDNTTTAGTDQSQTTQNATVEVGEADATTKKNKLAQSFIPSKTKIRGVNLWKIADTGTFTGTVTVSLQADTAGSPSGSDLATVTFTNAEYLALAVGEFQALFSAEYASLVVGNLYWIVISTSTSNNTNHPNLGTNSAGGYGSGSVKYNNTTDGWVAVSTIDLYFKTIEGVNNQIVKTQLNGLISNSLIEVPSFFHATPYGSATLPYSTFLGGNDTMNAYVHDGSQSIVNIPRNKAGSFPAPGATLNYFTTLLGNPGGTNTGLGNAWTIGDYVYINETSSQFGGSYPGTLRVFRLDKRKLTNGVIMTTSGGTMFSGNTSEEKHPTYSDGVFLYVYKGSSGTTWEKYSISGTTLTYVADVTGPDGAILVGRGLTHDGLNLYSLTISGGITTLSKYSSDGSLLLESATIIVSGGIWGATSSSTVLGLVHAGVGKTFMVVSVTFSTATSNNTGGLYYFLPIATS